MLTFEELEECIKRDMPKPPKRKKDSYKLPPDFWNPLKPNIVALEAIIKKCSKVKKAKKKEVPCKRCRKQSELCVYYPCIKFIKFSLGE